MSDRSFTIKSAKNERPATDHISSMSDEIIELICEHLKQNYLANVCYVNKTIGRVATDVLYRHCTLEWRWRDQNEDGYRRRLESFMHTISSAPYLASCVKSLKLGSLHQSAVGDAGVDVSPRRRMNRTCNCDAPVLRTDYPAHSLAHELRRALESSSEDAMSAVILSLLPQLELFNADLPFIEGDDDEEDGEYIESDSYNRLLLFRLVELAIQPTMPNGNLILGNLTKVSLSYSSRDWEIKAPGWDFRIVSLFIRLPSLITFDGEGCCSQGNVCQWACDDFSSGTKYISLTACNLDTLAVNTLLRSCYRLETLEIDFSCTNDESIHLNIDYGPIRQGLDLHRDSLSRLSIKECSRSFCKHATGKLAPLINFDKLVSLTAAYDALFSFDEHHLDSNTEPLPQQVKKLVLHLHDKGDPYVINIIFHQVGRLLNANGKLNAIYAYCAMGECREQALSSHLGGIVFKKCYEWDADQTNYGETGFVKIYRERD